jgi:hypothetical protein
VESLFSLLTSLLNILIISHLKYHRRYYSFFAGSVKFLFCFNMVKTRDISVINPVLRPGKQDIWRAGLWANPTFEIEYTFEQKAGSGLAFQKIWQVATNENMVPAGPGYGPAGTESGQV